jgi:hypothetical protein
MPALLDRACASRMAVLAANGLVRSGTAKLWDDQVAGDRSLVAQLVVPAEQNYARHSHQALEDELVALRAVRDQVDAIRDRYVSALAADDKERDRLKDAATARVRSST